MSERSEKRHREKLDEHAANYIAGEQLLQMVRAGGAAGAGRGRRPEGGVREARTAWVKGKLRALCVRLGGRPADTDKPALVAMGVPRWWRPTLPFQRTSAGGTGVRRARQSAPGPAAGARGPISGLHPPRWQLPARCGRTLRLPTARLGASPKQPGVRGPHTAAARAGNVDLAIRSKLLPAIVGARPRHPPARARRRLPISSSRAVRGDSAARLASQPPGLALAFSGGGGCRSGGLPSDKEGEQEDEEEDGGQQ